MIRWIFFFEEGNIKSDVSNEEEDNRISDFVDQNPEGTLYLPGDTLDLYVNLNRVKCIARQIVDEEAEKLAQAKKTPEIPVVIPEVM